MPKSYLSLQPSESHVLHVASRIYAAYISGGRVPEGQQDRWIEKSIAEALRLAAAADAAVISDEEVDTLNERI